MDRIQKLFSRLSQKERLQLQSFIDTLLQSDPLKNTNVKKLKGSDFFRARKGKFRIIFHYDQSRNMIIDSVRIRNEKTYKDV